MSPNDPFNRVPAERARHEVARLLDGGMTPSEIAEAAGLSRQYVSQVRHATCGAMIAIEVVTALRNVPTPARAADGNPDAWMARGACVGQPNDWWFPEPTNTGRRGGPDVAYFAAARKAKAICAGCPVKADCLDHALAHPEHHGIWGGLDPNERRQLKRRRREARRTA